MRAAATSPRSATRARSLARRRMTGALTGREALAEAADPPGRGPRPHGAPAGPSRQPSASTVSAISASSPPPPKR